MSSRVTFPDPVAHRGLHDRVAGIIENSAPAFAAAIDGGYAIECDLQMTADGVPVVFHDPDRKRLQGVEGLVADTSLLDMTTTPLVGSTNADCPQTLEAFLDQIGGRALLQIELKHQRDQSMTEGLARATADALASYQGPVTVESFDPRLIALVRDYGFAGSRGIITYDHQETYQSGLSEDETFVLRNLLHWHETKFDFISCASNALTLPAIAFWKALGVPVTAWTIRTQAEADLARPIADQIVFEGFTPRR
jgi:glycerophosphoryl diester phosphodiesterase